MSAMFEKLLNQQQTAMTQLQRTTETHIQSLRTECMSGYTELGEILSQSPKQHKGVESQPSTGSVWGHQPHLASWEVGTCSGVGSGYYLSL